MAKGKKESKIRKFFMFSKIKFAITVNLFIVLVIVHNAIYALSGTEEPFFFLASLLVFAYFVLASAYTAYADIIKK